MNHFHDLPQSTPTATRLRSLHGLAIALLMLGGALPPTTAQASESTLPRFVTQASTALECDDTPFGQKVVLWKEAELAELSIINDGNTEQEALDAYQLRHDGGSLRLWASLDMDSNGVNATVTVDMIQVDLNGDGSDELVAAGRRAADGTLYIVALGHHSEDNTGTINLLGAWSLNQTFNALDLEVGDFDGSGDGKQELAVFMTTSEGMRLVILTGKSSGGFAEADDTFSGEWTWPFANDTADVTSGDLLLDGRDQLLVTDVVYTDNGKRIDYHLLEYQTVNPGILTNWPGSTNIGALHDFQLLDDGFIIDGTPSLMPVDQITALETHAADMIDSAAAEIVTALQFRDAEMHYIGMQLQHYVTTRDIHNHITSIHLAQHPGSGVAVDSSIIAAQSSDGPSAFEAAVGNIDTHPGAEIIFARAQPNSGKIDVRAFKAGIRFVPGFTWRAEGHNVAFVNATAGDDVEVVSWNFGDGSSPVSMENTFHTYDSAGTHEVVLTVREGDGPPVTYPDTITISDNEPANGGDAPDFIYKFPEVPRYQGESPYNPFVTPTMVNLAVADMDANGYANIVTAAKTDNDSLTRTVWSLVNSPNPPGELILEGDAETALGYQDLTRLNIVPVDFDGDSLRAEVGTTCRTVVEPQVRQLVWLPPYFTQLQADSTKEAAFGESVEGGSEYEQRASSFTSHDMSGYVSLTIGDAAYGIEATAQATVGHRFQSTRGEIHANGQSTEISQSFSQAAGEGLVVLEEYSFDCYAYDLTASIAGSEPIPDSGLRMCALVDNSREIGPMSAADWDTLVPAGSPDHPPAQWVSLHRDWNSLALFHPASTNADTTSNGAINRATDGMFTTAVQSSSAMERPYIQIDLGEVRDISNIRIVPMVAPEPPAENPKQPVVRDFLTGFRIYASASPMFGDDIPSGPTVHVYEPMTADDSVYATWNAWTRNPTDPAQTLQARYIRLQHPGTSSLKIAEVQVFGDVHADPPSYPDAVCDENVDDDYFLARVWDSAHGVFRNIEVHGKLIWDGTGGPVSEMACTNDGELEDESDLIWGPIMIGGSGSVHWNLDDSQWSSLGKSSSFESANYVGADLSLTGGFVATVTAGSAYEFSTGVAKEYTTSTQWSDSLQLGGAISGFANPDGIPTLVEDCEYNARPYAYHLTRRSITGYRHDIYVVDYVVRQRPSSWQRGSVPVLCSHPDPIFANGFD